MNTNLITGLLITLLLADCSSTPKQTIDPVEQALAVLPSQPLDLEKQQSLSQLNQTELYENSQNPLRITVERVVELPRFDQTDKILITTRQPVTETKNAAPATSLSFRVQSSLLANCNQNCLLPRTQKQGGEGNLMLFSCEEGGTTMLREYYDSDGQTGFSLIRERVNVLIGNTPAMLRRLEDNTEGLTALAWRHGNRSYVLQQASASDETAIRLLAIARSLPH